MKDYTQSLIDAMNRKMKEVREARTVAQYDKAKAMLEALMEEYNQTIKRTHKKSA